mgnify:CR=1 FL=1
MQEECIVCKAPLIYLEQDEWMECELCHKKELSKTRCQNGHYVCNDCHTKGLDTILSLCIDETSRNPIEIVRKMMDASFCHMHGPEHHVMVGAALLTAYKNAGGAINLRESVMEMLNRGKAVPGGTCGFWGACGAGISAGMFVIMFAAVSNFSNCVNEIVKYYGELKGDCRQINSLHNILNVPYQSGNQNAENEEKARELVLENVSFRYSEGKAPTIQGINLHIKAGEKVALIGVNGAGKTTLIKVLCGLYSPDTGSMRSGDLVYREDELEKWQGLFSCLFQDIHVLPYSFAEIVSATTLEETDVNRVEHCLKMVGLFDKISGFPNGIYEKFNKLLNDDGKELSGGEKQKLLLARSLYRSAPIIILDEPTSALDPLAEEELYQSYNELLGGRTMIFVSHRLSSTRFCDRILFLESGQIAE